MSTTRDREQRMQRLFAQRAIREAKLGIYWDAVGRRMSLARLALGISEQEAAAAWQVTLRTYRKYEAGAPQRSIGPLLCFADRHDVSIDWLICGDPACLKRHLTSRAEGKVAILGARWRGA
jgi:transcriptional regulator with XRE-family HTH domain